MDMHYAIIRESEHDPVLYHMNQTATAAERLRARREVSASTPCFVVSVAAWHSDPHAALRTAQGLRQRE